MNEQDVRLEALRIAAKIIDEGTAEHLIDTAMKIMEFIDKGTR